jgi:hypothetical protein
MGSLKSFLISLPYASRRDLIDKLEAMDAEFAAYLADKPRHDSLYMDAYIRGTAMGVVYLSNKHEKTLPTNISTTATYTFLKRLVSGDCPEGDPPLTNGASSLERRTRKQLVQHTDALLHLTRACKPGQEPLTTSMIQKAHEILTSGLCDDSGAPIIAGSYRQHPSHAGDNYIYLPHGQIQQAMEAAVARFNSLCKSSSTHVVQLAADLFYDIITIHPFQDGNGRLCRLLASYAFMCRGVPFYVVVCNGHRKSAKHLYICICKARLLGSSRGHLYSYFLICLHRAWSNAYNHRQLLVGT